jgi:hypothetical protein
MGILISLLTKHKEYHLTTLHQHLTLKLKKSSTSLTMMTAEQTEAYLHQ